jgi:hypothetical protein
METPYPPGRPQNCESADNHLPVYSLWVEHYGQEPPLADQVLLLFHHPFFEIFFHLLAVLSCDKIISGFTNTMLPFLAPSTFSTNVFSHILQLSVIRF